MAKRSKPRRFPGPRVFERARSDAAAVSATESTRHASRPRRTCTSAATTGRSPANAPPTDGPWSPTTCTWAFACRTSGIGRRSCGTTRRTRQGAAHHRRLAARHSRRDRRQQRPCRLGFHEQRRRLGRRRDRDVDPNDKKNTSLPMARASSSTTRRSFTVASAPDEKLDVVSTIWGPSWITTEDRRASSAGWPMTRRREHGAVENRNGRDLEDALRLANLSGSPAQNFVVADDQGRIAWTIMGACRARRLRWAVAFGRGPTVRIAGMVTSSPKMIRVVEPEDGRMWTANGRVVSGDMLVTLGDGGYDLGAGATDPRRSARLRDDRGRHAAHPTG